MKICYNSSPSDLSFPPRKSLPLAQNDSTDYNHEDETSGCSTNDERHRKWLFNQYAKRDQIKF